MKVIHSTVLVSCFALLCSTTVLTASPAASIEKGKALFNDIGLGTTGSSCNTCHMNGKGLEAAAVRKQWIRSDKTYTTLEGLVNGCITTGLRGKALDVRSVEMQSIVLYIRSLAGTKGSAPMNPASY
jgi:mono/diheme cytochrome c family protein